MGRSSVATAVLPGFAPSPFFQRMRSGWRRSCARAVASIGAIVIAGSVSPATAASGPRAWLIDCGDQSCLQISGRRDDPDAIVSINGQAVPVEGERTWRVSLPLDRVRQLSLPYARTIEVSLHDPETRRATIAEVELPIGLLGGTTDLASLVINVR